ncbi:MAG: UvrD-helicase domain-containing protein, partial [Planctomycetota bacterium]
MTDQFDAFTCSLAPGMQVLEASAGTGKTYTIASLCLRLLLEDGPRHIHDLVVITFTDAAASELRLRIRTRLSQALAAFASGQPGEDAVLSQLLARYDQQEATTRLRDALCTFDRARITTIHGFCKRLLDECAFESGGNLGGDTFVAEDRALARVCADIWRQYCCGAESDVLNLALGSALSALKDGPAKLAGCYRAHHRDRILPEGLPSLAVATATEAEHLAQLATACDQSALVAAWREGLFRKGKAPAVDADTLRQLISDDP